MGLKEAMVVSMLDPTEPTNYWPILSLSFLGKVTERVTAEQLQKYLNDTLIPDPLPSGFCPGHGMEMVLVALRDDLCRQLGQSRLEVLF